ncbi:uncharacterized protein JCM10292_005323 [Rhodotorula paludigena]|uniref:uncharacterized protein n=1 Tax=Rhodotorula paludigena TaxID=86838 RepID=UPI003181F7D0
MLDIMNTYNIALTPAAEKFGDAMSALQGLGGNVIPDSEGPQSDENGRPVIRFRVEGAAPPMVDNFKRDYSDAIVSFEEAQE